MILILSLLGCMKNTVVTGAPMGNESWETTAIFFFWGAAGHERIDLLQVCPEGVAKIEEEVRFGDGVLGCFTLGVIKPVHITVTCASGTAWNLEQDPETGITWVLPA